MSDKPYSDSPIASKWFERLCLWPSLAVCALMIVATPIILIRRAFVSPAPAPTCPCCQKAVSP